MTGTVFFRVFTASSSLLFFYVRGIPEGEPSLCLLPAGIIDTHEAQDTQQPDTAVLFFHFVKMSRKRVPYSLSLLPNGKILKPLDSTDCRITTTTLSPCPYDRKLVQFFASRYIEGPLSEFDCVCGSFLHTLVAAAAAEFEP